jgi:hypothetical protein
MSYKNKNMTEGEFKESIRNFDEAINDLKKVLEISQNGRDNPKFPYSLSSSNIEREIKKLEKDKQEMISQFTCDHKNTSGLIYTGHDSHKDHYENKCLDCGIVIEWDSY